jgi:hypothetical protein
MARGDGPGGTNDTINYTILWPLGAHAKGATRRPCPRLPCASRVGHGLGHHNDHLGKGVAPCLASGYMPTPR